jgi:hypothetical protein
LKKLKHGYINADLKKPSVEVPKKSKMAGNTLELITLIGIVATWVLFIERTINAFRSSQGYFPGFIMNASFTIILSFVPIPAILTLLMAIFLWRRKGPNRYSYAALFTFSVAFSLPLLTLIFMYFSIKAGKVY